MGVFPYSASLRQDPGALRVAAVLRFLDFGIRCADVQRDHCASVVGLQLIYRGGDRRARRTNRGTKEHPLYRNFYPQKLVS